MGFAGIVWVNCTGACCWGGVGCWGAASDPVGGPAGDADGLACPAGVPGCGAGALCAATEREESRAIARRGGRRRMECMRCPHCLVLMAESNSPGFFQENWTARRGLPLEIELAGFAV